jgi:N-methylhydantoinase B
MSEPVTSKSVTAMPVTSDPRSVDPVHVEIIQGTLASVEREVETAIGRTARSGPWKRR